MIKLFRNLRQSLITQNRFSKYLFYAFGEIILVVIGILIALNINNRNDIRKERILETKILKEIQSNLKHDLLEIQDDIRVMDSVNLACSKVISYLENHNEPSNFLYNNVSIIKVAPHFDPNKSGYELLVSKGVEIISNDSLRGSISVLYESEYSYYNKYEEERIKFKLEQINPVLLKYFTATIKPDIIWKSTFYISATDYKKMRDENDFFRLVSQSKFENYMVHDRAKSTEKSIENLIVLIEKEL